MSDQVSIFEVGPRDGLQNERRIISTKDKIALVNALSETGLRRIEVSSFVSPKWVPQLADARDVFEAIKRHKGRIYAALVPNVRGLRAAIEAEATEVAIFASASESFSQKNINCSIAESMERFAPVLEMASQYDLKVRGYVSCVTDCPYEGKITPSAVASLTEDLLRIGCYEISLGDTIGQGSPDTVRDMLASVLVGVPTSCLAGHFHNTKGRALDNIKVCLEEGLRIFDSSIGGLGGCPYAPGAAGNVATEELVPFLEDMKMDTQVDTDLLQALSQKINSGFLLSEDSRVRTH